jgi:hypothetical protein
LLYDYWALKDVDASSGCPHAISEDMPAIVVVDNDDFKFDTMTGNAEGAHRTNVMFVQPAHYEKKPESIQSTQKVKKKHISRKLQQKWADLTEVHQYRCPLGSTSEPPIRETVDPPVEGTESQRIRSVIHALSRTKNDGEIMPPDEQQVPAYSGAQSYHLPSVNKSKPYYHTSYPEPPTKSVLHDIMVKLVEAMHLKNIPFSFLVGDMPTYKTITQLKTENPELFSKITPILGAFHQLMSYMYAIYKRFKESGMAETQVAAWVIVEGSVDQALRGKHYRRGIRCILLWREALIQQRLQGMMHKLSRIFRSACRSLRLNLLTVPYLHSDHNSLALWLHQSVCMTLKLQFQMAKDKLTLCCRSVFLPKPNHLLLLFTRTRDKHLPKTKSALLQAQA